ncbi:MULTISPECIES: Hpt domain-containing protein [unclassified Leeuwenhoekiella]|uniref:Hpt domain-containing protein n=1 Tax=unclassified Leeuwenhoekiella TaxID=2615029 RepID=UPI000C6157A1|nr:MULTISPECIES: Hpt domain-containing protein [unclassified Leeuwenhoekiella]MAW94834.1 Hpt domain-containing protein [Leeuwenhoekiella sp.]MBA79554.1 Hpt domain-containing protein [Leeuwenhoekiella sp.]|tara:strand:- start:1303 stop:1644 length:342 start_codon:yes stop_codon:yes gene_type:complete
MPKHYDLYQLEDMSGGDKEFMQTVVETFLTEIPPDLQSMNMAIDNDNHRMAYQFAHKMKPNLEMFGIDLIREISAMERWADSTKPTSAIRPQLETINKMVSDAIEEMRKDWKM